MVCASVVSAQLVVSCKMAGSGSGLRQTNVAFAPCYSIHYENNPLLNTYST